MNEIVLANLAADWRRLKMLVLDSVSSPITKRVYNLGLDEFFEWFGREPRPGFTKVTVSAWRVAFGGPRAGVDLDQRAHHGTAQTSGRSGGQRAAGTGIGGRNHAH
jgi:hypothetical protein